MFPALEGGGVSREEVVEGAQAEVTVVGVEEDFEGNVVDKAYEPTQ